MDDILIHAEDIQTLRERTKIVMTTLHEAGARLIKDKCEFEKTKIKFLGHIFTSDGIKTDEEKVKAIDNIKSPSNKKELQRLLGMVQYLHKFIPNLSEITYRMRLLLKKNTEWQWDSLRDKDMERIKDLLKQAPTLNYYDPNKDVVLSVDASQHAIGAVLLQEDRAIAYASSALNDAQRHYPQIEKEALAIKFGCKKFHTYIYGMSKDISDMVKNCKTCIATQRDKQKQPLMPKEIPELPWEIVASDIFQFEGNEYIVIIDSYSGFINFEPINTINSKDTIGFLKRNFSIHGIPKVLETDNGRNYASREFNEFSNKWKFNHKTSSPHYPKSNGLAERAVQIAKNILRKCKQSGDDIQIALLNYRNTPREDMGSPAQRLLSRRTKTILPISKELLRPCIQKDVTLKLRRSRSKQKFYYDKGSRDEPTFKIRQEVYLRENRRNWKPATIVREDGSRSYTVQNNKGLYRRNQSHITTNQSQRDHESILEQEPSGSACSTMEQDQETHPKGSDWMELQSETDNPAGEEETREVRKFTRSGRQKSLRKCVLLFEDKLGKYKGPPIHIELNSQARSTFLRAKALPYAKENVEKTLKKMEEQGIVTPIEFSKFATPIVPVQKRDGTIRICGDYRSTINTIVEPETFPVPAAADLQAVLAGGRVFSKLDFKDAYQQMVVDEETAELLTINTHKGLFRSTPLEKTHLETPEPADVFLLETNEDSPIEAKEVARLTREDPALERIVQWTRLEWPDHCPAEEFRPYFIRRYELSLQTRAPFAMRTTPHGSTGVTPAELLMGRRLTTRMDRLHPEKNSDEASEEGNSPNKFKSPDQ
ncbi:K02A2.6-like, partial [Cordylochernes scorpioides]